MQLKWFRAGPRDVQPHTVSNRRIYVLPTRFGLFVGLSLLVLTLGALNYNNNASLILGFVLISLCNNSLIAAHLALLGLTVRTQSIAPVFAGQSCLLETVLTKQGSGLKVPDQIFLNYREAVAEMQHDTVTAQACLTITTCKRGMLAIDRIR